MKRRPTLSLALLLALAASPAMAVSVYKCEDSKGNISYEAHCPPGTTPVDQKDYRGGSGDAEAPQRPPITVYLVPNCDSCAQVKEFLAVRNIRPVEKNVASDVKLQEELKATAGDLRVPVTVIGGKVINGYNRTEMLAALEAGGYSEAGGETAGEAESEEAAEEEVAEEAFAEEPFTEEEPVLEEPALEEPETEEAGPAE
jgi:glutaredoxin